MKTTIIMAIITSLIIIGTIMGVSKIWMLIQHAKIMKQIEQEEIEKFLEEERQQKLLRKPTDARIDKYGKKYRISLMVNNEWKVCENIEDLKDFYTGNEQYPFKNKKIAENALAETLINI